MTRSELLPYHLLICAKGKVLAGKEKKAMSTEVPNGEISESLLDWQNAAACAVGLSSCGALYVWSFGLGRGDSALLRTAVPAAYALLFLMCTGLLCVFPWRCGLQSLGRRFVGEALFGAVIGSQFGLFWPSPDGGVRGFLAAFAMAGGSVAFACRSYPMLRAYIGTRVALRPITFVLFISHLVSLVWTETCAAVLVVSRGANSHGLDRLTLYGIGAAVALSAASIAISNGYSSNRLRNNGEASEP